MLKVLLAEDDRNFGVVLKHQLEERGWYVNLVQDGVQTILQYIEHSGYDFVLLDMRLPQLDGINALRILRRINPALSVITFSGHATRDELEESLKEGAISYFVKPFRVAQLIEDMERYLETN